MKILDVKNLTKSFGNLKAVDNISFSLKKGEIAGFLGPNGAGKSTTLMSLMGFLKPDNGDVTIFSQPTKTDLDNIKNNVGYLAGDVTLNETWSGADHISLILRMRRLSKWPTKLIELFEFDINKKIKSLSTGNRQKLGIILALMHNPKLLILDEPTTGLDPIFQQHFYDELRNRVDNGATILMSSHNLLEVENLCDKVIVINKGKIIAQESISDIRSRKLYSVYLYFKKKIPVKILSELNLNIVRYIDSGVELSVKGNVKNLIKKLEKVEYSDLQIMHSTLEKVFMEYYK